ncbi:TetR/AcrR family transcriptional regulator [Myxococcus sp. AM001]|uniref:TetR/AcrR family transcriptional regulator n=1 Tax=Myxococcus vastator TaxID=2709664 RepID=UPI0013CFFA0D|nr:TetR/AcrR family transcriptional regulator [Myxococcus vastator]NVJ06176.1 TetR/AcrR family transcriptional regulator [Myxococcus sp. AM001]
MGRTKTIDDADILRIAERLFRDKGQAVSTRTVAQEAGISEAVLYQRFGSKDDLFVAAMTPPQADVEKLLGTPSPEDVKAHLQEVAGRLAAYFVELMPTLLHVITHPSLDRPTLAKWHRGLPFMQLQEALTARMVRWRDEGRIAHVEPAAAAQGFMAAVHSVAMFETMNGQPRREGRKAHVQSLVAVLWSGLEPHPAAAGSSSRRGRL